MSSKANLLYVIMDEDRKTFLHPIALPKKKARLIAGKHWPARIVCKNVRDLVPVRVHHRDTGVVEIVMAVSGFMAREVADSYDGQWEVQVTVPPPDRLCLWVLEEGSMVAKGTYSSNVESAAVSDQFEMSGKPSVVIPCAAGRLTVDSGASS